MAILIVAVMLFTTPHIVGFASMGKEEATTSAENTDVAAQNADAGTEEEGVAVQSEESEDEQSQAELDSDKASERKTTETKKEAKKEDKTEAADKTESSVKKAEAKTEAKSAAKKESEGVAAEEESTAAEKNSEEKDAEEETAEENTEAVTKEKKNFRYENDDVKIFVKESEAGAVPDNAELQVTPIEKDNKVTQKQYTEVRKKLLEKAENESYDIAGFLAYDITFVDENGDKVEPDGKVQVSMEYKKITMPEELKNRKDSADMNVTVMHLEEDTTGKVKDVVDMSESKQLKDITTTNKKVVKTVDFETESFSTFTITWTRASSIETTVNLVDEKGKNIELAETNPALTNLEIADRTFEFSKISSTNYSQYYKLTDNKKQNYQFSKAVVLDQNEIYDGSNGTSITSLETEYGEIYYKTANSWNRTELGNEKLYFVYTEMLSEVETVDSASKGIKIKMIDLEGVANQYLKNGNTSINLGGTYGDGSIKKNLVRKRLGADGYPIASNNAGSLSGLFNGATETNHLFIKSVYEKTGYYEYSGFENYAYLDTSNSNSSSNNIKNFKVYKQIGTPNNGTSYFYRRGNFMPYNSISDGRFSTNTNDYDEDGKLLENTASRKGEKLYLVNGSPNYYFGMEVSANFVQQKNGQVAQNGTKQPMVYEFNGDDDMWVFIDGTLVLDIGGIHDAHSGKINFATGVVSWKDCKTNGNPKESTTTIKALFKASGYFPDGTRWNDSKVNNYFRGDTFKDYSSHTLRMFYFERGAGASNLHMKFNLPVVPEGSVEVKKELSNTDKEKYANVQFKFKLHVQKAKGDGTFEDSYEVLRNAKSSDGKPIQFDADGAFYLKPGEKATFSGLKDHQKYYVEEIGVKSEEYDDIKINDVSYKEYKENESEQGKETKNVRTVKETAENRRLVVFTNNCSAANNRELRITKEMKDGQTTDDTFSFKIYLTSTEGNLVPYVGSYYLQDQNGTYYSNDNGKLAQLTDSNVAGNTDSEGKVTGIPVGYTVSITQILSGTGFKVQEIDPGNNYKVPEITVADCADGNTSDNYVATGTIKLKEDASVTVTNQKNYKKIKITKQWKDSDGTTGLNDSLKKKTLVGLYKGSDYSVQPEQVKELKASNAWACEFDILGKISEYTVKEIVESNGRYTVVNNDEFIKLKDYIYKVGYPSEENAGENEKQISIVNTLQRGSIEITKCNVNKEKLGGAEFEITYPNGSKNVVTTPSEGEEKGIIKITNLLPGEYTITETKAPEHYNLLTSPIKVTVGTTEGESKNSGISVVGDSNTYYYNLKLDVVNNKLFDMPEAGGGFRATIFGIAIMIIAGGWYIIRRRRRIV